ncbi:putative serine/threonine protein kinase, partial [Plesiocystis pacifica SIR-1]
MQGTLDNSIGDRFTEVVRLGDGAEGGTWRARDRRGRSVVLKRVVEGPRGDVTRAFEVLRRASSPHLPEALELLPDGKGGTWLVTAYVDGANLDAGPVPLARALAEALGVALALESIHGLGTHHGDVSANNVICMPTRDVVLTDLGQLGRLGCGTPGFLAPEVLRGGGGPAADRFAVGCLLCLRIYGEVPWLRPEAVLGVTDGSHVRERLRTLAAGATEPTPRPVTALLERLLDPEPHRRVAEAEQLVVRLRQLHRASRAGELVEAQSAWWVPRRWGYIGSRAPVDAAVEALRGGAVGLVAVAGPEGSGRGRIVEEIVAALQLQRARSERRDGELALLCEAEGMAAALGSPESEGDWIAAWMGSRRGAPARIWGLVESPPWPEKMRGRPELQAAVLRAGLGLGDAPQPLVVPASPALAQALRGEGVLVVERDPWTHAEVRACLTGVVEAVDAQRRAAELDAWSEAIHEATGGWPAKVIRAVEACARQGRTEHPERAVIEAALVSADSEARLEPERARGVLERRWGLDASEDVAQASEDEASEPLASLVAAARASLGDSVPVLARATLEQRRRQGLAISLALALDADDAAAVEDTADQGALGSDLLAWLEAGGALRVGPRLRLR